MNNAGYVLIVDDDQMTLQLLTFHLEALEIACIAASSGPDALDILEQHKHHTKLVLLDIAMPGMDGYAVCKAIRENPTTRHIPVVAVTARCGGDVEAKTLEAGINDLVIKPFTMTEIRAILRNYNLIE